MSPTKVTARRRVPLLHIEALVAAQLGPSRVPGNTQPAALNRQIAMYLAHCVAGWSTGQIGRFYNGRDHSTNNIDEEGNLIPEGWFEALMPISEYLRQLARDRLRDVWRLSELAELAVHAQWRRHGHDPGVHPHRRIGEYARWKAEDLRCGHWRLRKGTEVLLGDGAEKLVDQLDYTAKFENVRAVDQCRHALQVTGRLTSS